MCSLKFRGLRFESQPNNHPVADSGVWTNRKPKSMNLNLSSIARDRAAPRLELPNDLRRLPRTMIGFCAPHVGPLSTVQSVNHLGATTSMLTSAKPLRQNSKIRERQIILLGDRPTTSAKPKPSKAHVISWRGRRNEATSPLKHRQKLVGCAERQSLQHRRGAAAV